MKFYPLIRAGILVAALLALPSFSFASIVLEGDCLELPVESGVSLVDFASLPLDGGEDGDVLTEDDPSESESMSGLGDKSSVTSGGFSSLAASVSSHAIANPELANRLCFPSNKAIPDPPVSGLMRPPRV